MPSRLSQLSVHTAHTTHTNRTQRTSRSRATTPPVPAWVIIGLFSSLLLVILLTVLMATSNFFAASIVAITSTAALFVASSIALAAHVLVEKYPQHLNRFVHVEVDLSSVVSRGPSFRRGRRTSQRRHRRPDTYCDPDLPPYEPRQIEENAPQMSEVAGEPPSPWAEYSYYEPPVPPLEGLAEETSVEDGLRPPPPAVVRE